MIVYSSCCLKINNQYLKRWFYCYGCRFRGSTAQGELSASKLFISHMMRFVLTSWSLRRCFLIFIIGQVWFVVTFGPRFYGHMLRQVHKTLRHNESNNLIHWQTTHSTSVPSYTWANVTLLTTRSMVDIDREARLFIRDYETKCIEKRNATSDGLKLCPCLPRELREYICFDVALPAKVVCN